MKHLTCIFLFCLALLIPKSTFAQPSGVTNIAISANGKLLAKTVFGKNLTIWNLKPGQLTLKKTLPLSCDCSGFPLAFSPYNKTLAISYNKIQLWDVNTGKVKRTLKGYGASPVSFVFSPNGLLLAGSMTTGKIFIWSAQTGKLKYALNTRYSKRGLSGEILAFSGNNKLVTAGSRVCIWDITTNKELSSFYIGSNGESWMSIDAKNKTLVSRGYNINSPVRVWDIRTGKLRHSISLYGHNTKGIISPDGTKLITWSFEWKMLKEWDTRTGKLLHRWNLKPSQFFEILRFLPNGKQFVTSEGTNQLRFWNVH